MNEFKNFIVLYFEEKFSKWIKIVLTNAFDVLFLTTCKHFKLFEALFRYWIVITRKIIEFQKMLKKKIPSRSQDFGL